MTLVLFALIAPRVPPAPLSLFVQLVFLPPYSEDREPLAQLRLWQPELQEEEELKKERKERKERKEWKERRERKEEA